MESLFELFKCFSAFHIDYETKVWPLLISIEERSRYLNYVGLVIYQNVSVEATHRYFFNLKFSFSLSVNFKYYTTRNGTVLRSCGISSIHFHTRDQIFDSPLLEWLERMNFVTQCAFKLQHIYLLLGACVTKDLVPASEPFTGSDKWNLRNLGPMDPVKLK
ncbi:hypothetical protein WN944_013509 [Citrus x changshan-huyou]|uniref:Uncharacterized protein n=1 Tax=Citrus x changshan-huyou TaxID=2935761 RepID=A0AAP0M8U8_9ROSI